MNRLGPQRRAGVVLRTGAAEECFWLEFVRRDAERELHLQARVANLRTVPPDAP
jgi:hypothetical protein